MMLTLFLINHLIFPECFNWNFISADSRNCVSQCCVSVYVITIVFLLCFVCCIENFFLLLPLFCSSNNYPNHQRFTLHFISFTSNTIHSEIYCICALHTHTHTQMHAIFLLYLMENFNWTAKDFAVAITINYICRIETKEACDKREK